MASLSRYDKVKAVGKYAASLVYDVQRDYVSGSGNNARGRAKLSRLHRDLDGASPSWMLIGDELFSNWPTELDEPADNSPEFERQSNAIRAALGLYAVHQRSKKQGVAQKFQSDPSLRMTFGRACRRIEPDTDSAKGILRRLRVAENAPDFNGIVRSMRALIMLMRNTDIQVDYGSLASDLYLLQFSDSRGSVFQRWGRDYYSKFPSAQSGQKADK